MDDVFNRIAENIAARVGGPMKFRMVMQPVMALIFAVRAGLKDAKSGRSPYLSSLLTQPGNRAAILKDGWKDVGKVFLLAVFLDIVYQFIVQHFVYPGEIAIVAVMLAIVPYLVARELTTRIASAGKH